MKITAEVELKVICPHCNNIMNQDLVKAYYCDNEKCIFYNKFWERLYEDTKFLVTLEEI